MIIVDYLFFGFVIKKKIESMETMLSLLLSISCPYQYLYIDVRINNTDLTMTCHVHVFNLSFPNIKVDS